MLASAHYGWLSISSFALQMSASMHDLTWHVPNGELLFKVWANVASETLWYTLQPKHLAVWQNGRGHGGISILQVWGVLFLEANVCRRGGFVLVSLLSRMGMSYYFTPRGGFCKRNCVRGSGEPGLPARAMEHFLAPLTPHSQDEKLGHYVMLRRSWVRQGFCQFGLSQRSNKPTRFG